jgi:hypothetical protein
MLLLKQFAPVFLAGWFLALFASPSFAQCSGGGRAGAGMTMTTGSVTPMTFNSGPANSLAAQQAFAYQLLQRLPMQQQMYQQQQQLLATRAQQMRMMRQQWYDQQQEILADRLARADAKRAERADRIAARMANQHSEQTGDSSGTVLATSTLTPSTEENPFR